jgi:DMSO/TMAO reductase YedYZ molybdopterin-dependent catalytic subunit
MTAMDNDSPKSGTNDLHVVSEPEADSKDPKAPPMPPEQMDRAAAMQMKVPGLLLTLADIQALPKTEMIVEFKCVEGWSTVVHWGGARFSDFLAAFSPTPVLPYASFVTPDGGYYTGWDVESLLHPQTLLCYEMNGQPLTVEHGAPVRLVSTLKYGIKQIKRIGRITFMADRPADFWGDRGYDWYSGL